MATTIAPERKTEARTIQEERPFTLGSVWAVDFVRVRPGRGLEYARRLAETWRKVLDEQKKEGLILSYKVLSGVPSSREDFTTMLMIEYPNFSAFDQQEKLDAITKKVFGSLAALQEMLRERDAIREPIGSRLLREVHFK